MAILRNTHCRDKKRIINSFYPFSNPERIKGMIIGNDLDSLLSASFLKGVYNWDIAGVYDYTTLCFSQQDVTFISDIKRGSYLSVDLDIYHPDIPSVGHHVLANRSEDILSGHRLTLNPNFIRGISTSFYRRKYPLGTIHFLIWLFDIRTISEAGLLLAWLADSAYINGQKHRFRENVNEWINSYLAPNIFQKSFTEIDNLEFETKIKEIILPRFDGIGICRNRGQVKSRHLGLTGFQCQWTDLHSQISQINDLINLIDELTEWGRPKFPQTFSSLKGCRKSITMPAFKKRYGDLDTFLEQESVFSYAINYNQALNYTIRVFNLKSN